MYRESLHQPATRSNQNSILEKNGALSPASMKPKRFEQRDFQATRVSIVNISSGLNIFSWKVKIRAILPQNTVFVEQVKLFEPILEKLLLLMLEADEAFRLYPLKESDGDIRVQELFNLDTK